MAHAIPIVILAALAASSQAQTPQDSQEPQPGWSESHVLFYTIRAHEEDAQRLDDVTRLLTAFHEGFLALSGMDAAELGHSRITIILHPPDSPGGQLGYASMHSRTEEHPPTPTSPGGFGVEGEVNLPGPLAHDGSATSTSGHPMDQDYFDKLLIHEVSPVYLEVYARNRNARFHHACPPWFEQGLEEFCAVWLSTPHWRDAGYQHYVDRWRERQGLDADFGVNAVDQYNDGLLLTTFIAHTFGQETLWRVISQDEPTFGKRLHAALDTDFDSFRHALSAWLEQGCPGPGDDEQQAHPPAATPGAPDDPRAPSAAPQSPPPPQPHMLDLRRSHHRTPPTQSLLAPPTPSRHTTPRRDGMHRREAHAWTPSPNSSSPIGATS